MTANELRRLYINFFVDNYDHKEIKGSSLIPENDPTVLFTTAGMHPLVPFLMGEKHPSGTRLVDVQKCIRTGDIDEVGDDSHLTMFEMLGNWSLGDYFKKEAIEMSFKFLTSGKEAGGLDLGLKNLAFTCFEGDDDAPKDEESFGFWKELGVPEARIAFLPKKDNWWGPAGQTGPCGPDSEMFFWTGDDEAPEVFDTEDSRWVEIWNDVFMQYNKTEDGKFEPLSQTNVDTGMGLERVIVALTGKKSVYETEMFEGALNEIRTLAKYDPETKHFEQSERIIADHIRSATFIMGDKMGISPSNTDQGYIVRRLIRRAIRHGKKMGIEGEFVRKIAGVFIKQFGDYYTELNENQDFVYEEIVKEEKQFNRTLHTGLKILNKEMIKVEEQIKDVRKFDDKFFFEMFATYGFPIELTIEELQENGWLGNGKDSMDAISYITEKFEHYFKEHQEKSRAGAEKKFAGGLADHSEEVTKYHTATHLLHQALLNVLGDHVEQRGANLTAERLRFDFSHPEKMTPEQKEEVVKIVNDQIDAALPVTMEEMPIDEAKAKGAIGLFESKYGDRVKVYSIGSEKDGVLFSREICGGPHVANTSELGRFKIKKEESSSSGVRRIKGVFIKED